MSVQEILNLEKRNENNLYDIHFYLEGLFWRAYEWSAYLSTHLPGSKSKLNPLKKVTKSFKNGYVCVGLQLPSFEKYFPNVVNDESVFEMLNKHIVIHAKSFFENNDFTDYEKMLDNWKNSIKLSNNEKKKHKDVISENVNNNISSIDLLVKEIISYPIENKNLMESLQFLSYIRDKAIKITKDNDSNMNS